MITPEQVGIIGTLLLAAFTSAAFLFAWIPVTERREERRAEARYRHPAARAQRAQARHASRRPVDTPAAGVRGLRPAAQHSPDTIAIDHPVGRPYVPALHVEDRPTGIPNCRLCVDGMFVIGVSCILCGHEPILGPVA